MTENGHNSQGENDSFLVVEDDGHETEMKRHDASSTSRYVADYVHRIEHGAEMGMSPTQKILRCHKVEDRRTIITRMGPGLTVNDIKSLEVVDRFKFFIETKSVAKNFLETWLYAEGDMRRLSIFIDIVKMNLDFCMNLD